MAGGDRVSQAARDLPHRNMASIRDASHLSHCPARLKDLGKMRWTLAIVACAISTSAVARLPQNAGRDETRAMFARVIAFPTVIGRAKVPEMAAYLGDAFRQAGWPAADISLIPYDTGNRDGSRVDKTAALIVRWRAAGQSKQRPIMVMGHMDVVDARAADFTSDPFVLAERDGYFYGRGSVYMKGGIVAVVRAMIELRARGFKPKRDISLLFTGDKESHGLGAEKAVKEWLDLLGNPEFGLNADGVGVLVGEDGRSIGASMPTAEKAYADYTLTVRNPGGHSGKPRPDNAIYSLARALGRVAAHRFPPVMNETTRAYFNVRRTTAPAPLAAAIERWLADPVDDRAADTIEATESEIGLTRTTCVATMMKGGHATNALPELATALVNCRLFPGTSPDLLRDELEETIADRDVAVTRNDSYPPSITSPLRADVTAAFTKAVQTIHPGMPVAPTIVTGATDARTFRAIGIPVYAVSAQWLRVPADLRVNQRDERIPVKSLYDGVRHWQIMFHELAGR